ncbi:MAG: protein kinase, partial [Chloroflexi bacterium]|nr:protein kinase [Chloroflexota bacterium]
VSIDDGEVPAGELHETLTVPYIIFELADGDVRQRLDQTDGFDLAFVLRALHHSAVGIRQLHDAKVAHQDLKPSNVLDFRDDGCRVADLGRSSSQDGNSPHDNLVIAGDTTYAPPELLYGHISPDWRVRRFACDLYQIGSLAVFFFTQVGITALWHEYLDRTFLPDNWGEGYASVLPHVRQAHDLAFEEFEEQLPDEIRGILGPAVRQLCDPDPGRRGHPRNLSQRVNRYSVQRYISIFDRIARIAEWRLRKTMT